MGFDEFNSIVGENMRRMRRVQKLTQAELARELELSRPTIVNMESGRQNFYAHTLAELAEVLDCKVTDFLPASCL